MIPFSRYILYSLRELFNHLFDQDPTFKPTLDNLLETYVEIPLNYVIHVDRGASMDIKMAHTGVYFKVGNLKNYGNERAPIFRVICQALRPPHLRVKSILR